MMIMTLPLVGYMQSWCTEGKWKERPTRPFPSKSAVVGMFAAALGLQRGDPHIAEISAKLHIAMRADRKGTVNTDYHTITVPLLLNADGGKRVGGNTLEAKKGYLFDAAFLAAITGPDELLEDIFEALNKPAYQLYLGRKDCCPSTPIKGKLHDKYSSLLEALQNEPLTPRHDEEIFCQIEGTYNDGDPIPDEIVDITRQSYTVRYVKTIPLFQNN